VWYAAHAILRGADPYTQIGPGLAFPRDWRLAYPLTAGVVTVPLSLPEVVASALFACLGTACLAWTLMRYGYSPLFGFVAYPVREALYAARWSPLQAALLAIPRSPCSTPQNRRLTPPTSLCGRDGPSSAGSPSRRSHSSSSRHGWRTGWAALARYRAQVAPVEPLHVLVTFPGGVVVLLCLLRWRRPEARLVTALACMPISLTSYELVPLLLVPRTFWESATLVTLSYVHQHATTWFVSLPSTLDEYVAVRAQLTIAGLYLPTTVMILKRPNEAALLAGMERSLSAWPAWLRGRALVEV
jgi:hypothetical protein